MAEFCMPSLGSDMEDGTLVEWEKQVGDVVHRGDIIAVVETQKGAIEVEVYEDGIVEKMLISIGDKVPVGTPMAFIGDGSGVDNSNSTNSVVPLPSQSGEGVESKADTDAVAASAMQLDSKPDSASVVQDENSTVSAQSPPASRRLRVTPAARQLAYDLRIDLTTLVGTGADTAIVLDDVKTAIERDKRNPPNESNAKPASAPIASMRAAIAAAMSRSKREIPHYYLSHAVDVDNAVAYIGATNAERAPENRLVLGAMFIKSVALAAKHYPEFNGYFENDVFTPSGAVHIGMAINLRSGGLVAPAIHATDELSLDETMAALRDLVARVRKGRFKASEISDPTLTVSSLGERGVDSLYGVIYPPQVAIVGFGTPVQTAHVRDGAVVPINTVTVTLAADHRVSDGHRGSLFLRAIERNLQKPEELQ